MKNFIVDWGNNSNGSRFGIIQADSIEDALMSLDGAIGIPDYIAPFEIPENKSLDIKYIEIEEPKNPFIKQSFTNIFDWEMFDIDV